MYYPNSENKGADQLHSYRKADLRLCFRICKKPVFSRRGSNYLVILSMQNYLVCKILPLFDRTTDYIVNGVPEDNTLPDVEPVCRTNQNDECVCDWDSYVSTCGIPGNSYMSFSGASCSKLSMS